MRFPQARLLCFVASLLAATPLTAHAQSESCPTCLAELDITATSPGEGHLTRVADDTYATWSAGGVKLSCDDGTAIDAVDLGIEPYDLEHGIDLQSQALPSVDLTAAGLSCELQLDDGLQSATIDVTIL